MEKEKEKEEHEVPLVLFDAELCSERHKRIWQMLAVWTLLGGAVLGILFNVALGAQREATRALTVQEGVLKSLDRLERGQETLNSKIDDVRSKMKD